MAAGEVDGFEEGEVLIGEDDAGVADEAADGDGEGLAGWRGLDGGGGEGVPFLIESC